MTTLRLRNNEWLAMPGLQKVLAVLNQHGTARVVGGAVRNGVLGRPVDDVDIATDIPPQRVMEIAKKAGIAAHATGLEHGTVTLVAQQVGFEVTTLRCDIKTDGRHAEVSFTTDWAQDAARRDFTINGLYCNSDGEIFDPLDGYADISSGTVRFIGDASLRICEDYLRILRFFRFFAAYGTGEPDAVSLNACGLLRNGLQQLSRERVGAEMEKLLVAPRAVAALQHMVANDILSQILKAPVDLARFARLRDIENATDTEPQAMRALASLGVEPLQTRDDLRLSNQQFNALQHMTNASGIGPEMRDHERRVAFYQMPRPLDGGLLAWAQSGAAQDDREWRALLAMLEGWEKPIFPVKGADLLALGFKPGPQLGDKLQQLRDLWLASDFSLGQKQLLANLNPKNSDEST